MSRTIEFTKMHGAGNDYIYVDASRFSLLNPEALVVAWSDRHKGIGADGLVMILPADGEEADFRMRMFNADGSEGRMCGNASRCIAKYVYEHGLTQQRTLRLATLAGVKRLQLHVDEETNSVQAVTVDMGVPAFDVPTQFQPTADGKVTATDGNRYEGTFVSVGNPHFVVFVQDVERLDVAAIGPTLEHAAAFPERVNVEFAEVKPDGTVRMRVWERGSGITQACGTGACATAVAAVLTRRTDRNLPARIQMDGGTLCIQWRADDDHILMEGPATEIFTGHIKV